jgi:hypothetical protein
MRFISINRCTINEYLFFWNVYLRLPALKLFDQIHNLFNQFTVRVISGSAAATRFDA